MKIVNGHIYGCFYMGRVVYSIDGNHFYDAESAAKALELTLEEFEKV